MKQTNKKTNMPLSAAQLSKLRRGLPIQLKHEQIIDSGIDYQKLNAKKSKAIAKAYHSGKGCRVCLDKEEIEGCGFARPTIHGDGIKSIDKKISAVTKKIGIKKEYDDAKKQVKKSVLSAAKAVRDDRRDEQQKMVEGGSLAKKK